MSFPRYYGQRSFTPRLATKSTMTVKTFKTLDAVAAAVIAFKQNANKIEKYDTPAMAATEYHPATPMVVSNKSRALAVLASGVPIAQEYLDEAAEIINYLQSQVTMSVLSGKKVSDFTRDLVTAFENDTVPQFKLGLLLYAPNTWHTGKARDAITEETTECLYTSQPLGYVGDKVTVNFTMLEKRYIQSLDCFAVYGKDDKGDLISFLTKHEKLAASGTYTGKVKSAGNDQYHNNAMVTSLNYVKAA